MPVDKSGEAQLWFTNQADADAYDDRMVASIELKSTNFDDENFSPVFNRATQEFFLQPGERFRNDMAKIFQPLKSHNLEELVDKFCLYTPNHTFNRGATIDKFFAGFGLGYLLLRELPLRNFYARCFVMYVFAAKFLDHMRSPVPYFGPQGHVVAATDRWSLWDVRCYDNAYRAIKFIEIPTVMNKVRESKIWEGKQPAHLLRADFHWAPHYFSSAFRSRENAHWDGTMNMPLHRLADPKHKDSYAILFQ